MLVYGVGIGHAGVDGCRHYSPHSAAACGYQAFNTHGYGDTGKICSERAWKVVEAADVHIWWVADMTWLFLLQCTLLGQVSLYLVHIELAHNILEFE